MKNENVSGDEKQKELEEQLEEMFVWKDKVIDKAFHFKHARLDIIWTYLIFNQQK